jgi:hypothetical protein
MKRVALVVFSLLFAVGAQCAEPDTPPPSVLAARARTNGLIEKGFNYTRGFRLKPTNVAPARLELLFPGDTDDQEIFLWINGSNGKATFRFTGPDGKAWMNWAATDGEVSFSRQMPRGKYVFELEGGTMDGVGLLGIKGPVTNVPVLNPAAQEYPASPAQGFHWPYYLYVPKDVRTTHFLVAPNNTGAATQDLPWLRASAGDQLNQQVKLADRLGAPLLIPMFPRPQLANDNLYLHALTRDSIKAQQPAYKRVDLQLLAMMRDATARLAGKGISTDARIMLWGFSASGSFVGRFGFLHPDNVLAVASGSPGGLPILPVANHDGARLTYPIGIADVKALTGKAVQLDSVKKVAFLIYMGDKDENDSVIHRDSFSAADEKLVSQHFGSTPNMRWKKVEALYAKQGLDARFVLYPDVAHEVTPAMHEDIAAFFQQQLAK